MPWPSSVFARPLRRPRIELSSITQIKVNPPFIGMNGSSPEHINLKLLCSQFETPVNPLVQRTIDPCKTALSDAGLESSNIKEAIVVVACLACQRLSRPSRMSKI